MLVYWRVTPQLPKKNSMQTSISKSCFNKWLVHIYIYIYVGYIERQRERGYYTTLTFITISSFHLIFVHHFPWWFSSLAFAWSAPEVASLGLATQVLLLDFSVTTGSSSADIGKARLSGWLFDLGEYELPF